ACKVLLAFHRESHEIESQLLALALDVVDDNHGARVVALVERCHARDFGKHLVKQLDPLWPEGLRHEAQSRDIPAGASEARHRPRPYWIGRAQRSHRETPSRVFIGLRCWG